MGEVLDRWRLNQGYNPYDNTTQDLAIQSWVHLMDREGVPASCYGELYERAIVSRAATVASGKQLPQFGAELLLAEWTGPNGLQRELNDRAIRQGRTLTANAPAACAKCNGSGWRPVGEGRTAPVTPCDHNGTRDRT